MMRSVTLLAAAALAVVASACVEDDPLPAGCPGGATTTVSPDGGLPLLGGNDCDPLVPTQCGFPMPSNVYLDPGDPDAGTAPHVHFGATTLPQYQGAGNIDATLWNDSDGFSPGQPAITHLPGATVTGLPTQDTIADSLGPDSPTVLMEADTGVRVPHFAELDVSMPSEDPSDDTFMIRPVVRLKDSTRYIVAIRHVVDDKGVALPPTPVFQALRDGTPGCDPSVAARQSLYADIFAKLSAAGIATADLQIAWDYTTASRVNNTSRFLAMRDDALAKVGADGPPYTITLVEEDPNPWIRRRITGLMTVPLYLDSPDPGGKLTEGPDGLPVQNGTAQYGFVVHIPNSATTGTPGPPLQNGHGLLGSMTEGEDGYLAQIADTNNMVAFGVDLIGMAQDDVVTITNALVSDVGGFKGDVGRQHQGILNSLLAMRMMLGGFSREPQTFVDGHPTIDPTVGYYRGDSQGGIFGTTYMAVSTDVTRGLLGEPGVPYSLLLNRSADFGLYFVLLGSAYHTGRNIQEVLGVVQMLWDRTEPDGYVPYLAQDLLPGTPAHTVLIHAAIGDQQVTTLGAHIIARTVGARSVEPVNREIYGVTDATAPFSGSGIVEYDFGLPPVPETDVPPTMGEDPHDKVRSLPTAIAQEGAFLRTGTVVQTCSGKCSGM